MKLTWMTRRAVLAGTVIATGAARGGPAIAQGKKEIKIGFLPGPYADHFKRAIQSQLEVNGYKIAATEFSNIMQLNTGLMDGAIDVNVFQNKGSMDIFNGQNKADLTELLRIPSAPMGLYSDKVKGIDGIKEGMTVSIPNDPTSLARSLIFLQSLGLIKVDPAIEPTKVTEKNVVDNPKKLKLVPIDAPQMPRSMADVDLSTPLGNHVIASGRLLSSALALEDPAPQFHIILVTRAGSANSAWAQDIVAAYKSDAFKTFIQNDPKTKGFSTPPYWR
jgi:D-methionine transport system substrate-binding protein